MAFLSCRAESASGDHQLRIVQYCAAFEHILYALTMQAVVQSSWISRQYPTSLLDHALSDAQLAEASAPVMLEH